MNGCPTSATTCVTSSPPSPASAPTGIWSAPGRLELPSGAVIVIDRRAVIAAGGRDDDRVRIVSATAGEVAEIALGELDDVLGQADWVDAVLAAFAALRAEGADLAAVPGVDLAIDSTVPEGVGLGSRAAIRDAVIPALRDLWRLPEPASTPVTAGRHSRSDDDELVVIAAGADGPDDPVLALATETARENGATATYPIGDGSLLAVCVDPCGCGRDASRSTRAPGSRSIGRRSPNAPR